MSPCKTQSAKLFDNLAASVSDSVVSVVSVACEESTNAKHRKSNYKSESAFTAPVTKKIICNKRCLVTSILIPLKKRVLINGESIK